MKRADRLKVVFGVLGSVALVAGLKRWGDRRLRVGCRLGRPVGVDRTPPPVMAYFWIANPRGFGFFVPDAYVELVAGSEPRAGFFVSDAYLELAGGERLRFLGRHAVPDIPHIEPGAAVSYAYPMRSLAELLVARGYERAARVDLVVRDHAGRSYGAPILVRGLRGWAEAEEGPKPTMLRPFLLAAGDRCPGAE